jgi:hypothetical protein
MKKLEVGDKLYFKHIDSYRLEGYSYSFYTVTKVTAKQAVLQCGAAEYRCHNMPNKAGEYKLIGGGDILLATDEVLKDHERLVRKKACLTWFNYGKQFTDEEKVLVYEYFESLGKLENPFDFKVELSKVYPRFERGRLETEGITLMANSGDVYFDKPPFFNKASQCPYRFPYPTNKAQFEYLLGRIRHLENMSIEEYKQTDFPHKKRGDFFRSYGNDEYPA